MKSQASSSSLPSWRKRIFGARPALIREIPGAAKIEKPNTDKDAALPAHPGAAAYIDGTQKNFFERYSDYIYMGVLLLSVAGSGLAGLLSFSKAGDRAQRLEVLDRLIALIPEAHAAKSCEELDRLTGTLFEFLGKHVGRG